MEDNDLVMYAVNGLNERFSHAKHIILHHQPFPDLDIARSMLLMEEMAINHTHRATTDVQPNSSHLTVLVAEAPPPPPAQPQAQQPHSSPTLTNYSSPTEPISSDCLSGPFTQPTTFNNGPAMRSSTQPGLLPSPPGFNRPTGATFGPQQLQFPLGPQTFYTGHLISFTPVPVVQPNNFGSFTVDPRTQTQETVLPSAFSTMTLQDFGAAGWHMDTCASTHLTSCINNLRTVFNNCKYPSVAAGDGNTIPVTNTGHSLLPTAHRPLHLNNVLVTPNIVKNLISVQQFTRDNIVSVEFDPFGFSVKYYLTHRLLLRYDSTGDLYPLTATSSQQAFLTNPVTWHQRLGHPEHDVF
ncbi:uncharacterized protein [Rutidosis leptorrhynchoides]|uniref:uncharacterized protein n=1 Tax=Rutidosis leptorrhynchoides TaxID=125765 RepID=UPI003A98F7BD